MGLADGAAAVCSDRNVFVRPSLSEIYAEEQVHEGQATG